MASVRFADVQSRPTEFLDFTSLTLDEFHQLVPSFEAAFQVRIPRQSCHRFQVNPATDSTAKLPPVPPESCH